MCLAHTVVIGAGEANNASRYAESDTKATITWSRRIPTSALKRNMPSPAFGMSIKVAVSTPAASRWAISPS